MGFLNKALPFLGGGAFSKTGKNILLGSPEQNYQQSLLTKQQQPILTNVINAAKNQGAGGAFGTSADYYRDLLSNDSQTNAMMAAPELRRFNEEIVPDLSEQFAGMGSGALSSSGFRNAAVNAGTDLSERLGAIRAQLRSQGAAGLAGIGQQALGQYQENIHRPATPGLLQGFAQGAGQAVGSYLGGKFGGTPSFSGAPSVGAGPGVGGAQTGRISR